jgi:phenylalanyl-tRNA synthetase beta chain
MNISYNWLKQYIDIDIEPELLSTILTDIGLEVEGVEEFQSIKGGLEGVVTGEVITCEQHANADKLKVTTVDIGDGSILPIVCGASNVAAGQKILVATVGTNLYSGDDSFVIKKAKIRGEVSEGMICAEDELGIGNSHDGIKVLPQEVVPGIKAAEYFNIENDIIYEIGLTPNRSDATSHIGVARDLVAGLNHYYNTDKYLLNIPDVENFSVDNTHLNINVVVEDTLACPRYSGVGITNIKVEESPEWLKVKLNAIGIRPINNIVDITNYVLHETGQPLHAFDADKIKGNKVVIRKTVAGTNFTTLDEIERKLDPQDLMICNSDYGMCIAGVFGGIESGVSNETVNIFLESAYFDSKHIRKTSKRHGLQTDASFRFERGADPNITIYALKRAALLMKDIAGGRVSSEIVDVYPEVIKPWDVDINFTNVDRLIGETINRETIKKILYDLEVKVVEETDESMKLLVPTFKVDVTREVDIVEEILRIYGYNRISIPEKLNSSISGRPNPDLEKIQNSIADYLVGQGFSEIMNNSLTKADYIFDNKDFESLDNVNLLNPLSKDLNVLRQTLLFGGLETISYNLNRKLSNLGLFEFGSIYKQNDSEKFGSIKNYSEEKHLMLFISGKKGLNSWENTNSNVNIFSITGIVNGILEKTGFSSSLSMLETESDSHTYTLQYKFNGTILAEVSLVSNKLLKQFDLNQEVYCADINWSKLVKLSNLNDIKFIQVSKFPSVKRDLSLVLDRSIRFSELKEIAFKTERKLLKNVDLFDIYEGSNIPEDKKSYALSFVLQDETKTLTDKVIDKTMKRILSVYEQQFKAQIR